MSLNEVRPRHVANLDGYATDAIAWDAVRQVLNDQLTQAPETGGPARHTAWLTTIDPDGSPHVRPLGVVSAEGAWYFTSGPGTGKSRNLARDPRCVLSVATNLYDLVLEGSAERATDGAELERVAAAFRAQGWDPDVAGDAFTAEYSAPSAGPPPWHVYRLVPTRVYAFGTAEPYGATRFDL